MVTIFSLKSILFRIYGLCLVLFAIALNVAGQGTYTPPKISEKTQRDLDEIVLASKAGRLEESILQLKTLIVKNPTWIAPRHELSRVYYESGKLAESIETLKASVAIDTASQVKQLYSLARLYEQTGQEEIARQHYQLFISKAAIDDPLKQTAIEILDRFLERQLMMKRHYEINLLPMPGEINTENHEQVGRWTLDGRGLIFQRVTNGQEDLYVAALDSNQKWIVSEFPFNTTDNEGAPAFSPDGKYLVFTSCNRRDGMGSCDLYISVKKNGAWTKPVNMGPGFNSSAWEGQPCFGLDGVTLYFSSNREGGFGGRDIWYMYQVSSDSWSRPISAGPGINTADNEGSPFIYFDGNTMYFMRDGKQGIGGFDLYISRKGLDGKWQKGENMGPPINTSVHEGALAVHPDGTTAMITRSTTHTKDDLFVFNLPADFVSVPQQQVNVLIKDKTTGAPLRAQLEIFEAQGDPSVRLSQWSNEAGELITTINRNVSYGIIANTPNYLMYSANLEADSQATRNLEIFMIPLEKSVNESIVLENIFFETGSAKILPASEPELQKLLHTLRTNQSMTIELRGHTDNVGDDASNQELSEARAKAVYDYIVAKGITSARLSFKGFGETQPIADNETAIGRQKNRRTEFYIKTK